MLASDSFIVVVVYKLLYAVFECTNAKRGEQITSFQALVTTIDGNCNYLSIYLFNLFDEQVHIILRAEINIREPI